MNIYFYKMTTDNGGAPCVAHDIWSLAICKPRIRSTALERAVIIGFAGQAIDPEHGVIHIARVTKRLENGKYYDSAEYKDRPDCIYRRAAGDWTQIDNKFHKLPDMDRDLGKHREYTQVLLSDDFRYFGKSRVPIDRNTYPHVRDALDGLTQGHRRWHEPALLAELGGLVANLYESTSTKVIGASTQEDNCPCNREDDEPIGICS
jgi:hypothetical protein